MRDEFMITRQGKQFVLFEGLLDEAHERGLRAIDTELLQVPSDENGRVAVVKATVAMEDERSFDGIGDASPENVGRTIIPHLIRMAETRAKARALRDAINVAATALEELSDSEDSGTAQGQSNNSAGQPVPLHANQRRGNQPSANTTNAGGGSSRNNSASGSSAGSKARKSQVDLLKTLAVELRGENGLQRLEERIGKSLADLTREEAGEWIDKLSPADNSAAEKR